MKVDEIKTTSGYQAIKAKTLQFPPDLIDIKPSARQQAIKSSLDVSIPPLYAFRFLTPSNATAQHEEVNSSRASKLRVGNSQHTEDKRLPPVELTINKKIKFPHNKQHQATRNDRGDISKVTPSDREVIEQLRQHLRTQPRNGTTSVLEAIGDPQVREERFYYEPLSSFLENKDYGGKEKVIGNVTSLRVVNIMIPAFGNDQDGTDFVLPLTLSRQQPTNNRSQTRHQDGAVRAFSYLPKVVGNSLSRKEQKRESHRLHTDVLKSSSQTSTESAILLPPSNSALDDRLPRRGMHPRKTPVNLPRIGAKRGDDDDYDLRDGLRRRKGVAPTNQSPPKRNATTVQLPTRNDDQNGMPGFPRRATTTATGKSHLIGPMNKMDMIAYYSKALQDRMITYDEYIKKLSVLSLHKVTLPNSSLRHFQIVRDESHNMKPRLTHVDVNPMSAPQPSPVGKFAETNFAKIPRPSLPTNERAKTNGSQSIWDNQTNDSKSPPRLHRIDIGEGLALSEEDKESPDQGDDVITTDLTRYSHVHHPRVLPRQPQYHWNHESAYLPAKESPGYREKRFQGIDHDTETTKGPKPQQYINAERRGLGSREMRQGFAPRRLGSVSQERWELPTVGEVVDDNSCDAPILNPDDVTLIRQSGPSVGKIPYPASGAEPMGMDGSEVLSTIDFRLAGDDVDRDSMSDAESVFQPHLENMLKTIKRAKAGRKRSKVPEVRGLVPTVIPQLKVDESGNNGIPVLRVEGQSKSYENLQIVPQFPDNTPPPTARGQEKNAANDARSLFVSTPKTNEGEKTRENVRIFIDKHNSQLIVNPQQSPQNTNGAKTFVHASEINQQISGSADVRVMTASVDLGMAEEEPGKLSDTPSRLEIVITAVSSPQPPPNSVVTDSAEE